ncbi:MAG: hypothetical protein ABW022_02720 [Actinoplanes sp.]
MPTRTQHLVGWTASAALVLGCASPGVRDGDSAPLPSHTPESSSPAPPSVAVASPTSPPPQERRELSAEQQRTGDALAARIRPKLTALRTAGDFTPASTRLALLDLGIAPDDVQVTTMRPPTGEATPPGAVYAVRFAGTGCLIGDVRPERVLVEVTGADPEYGCLEPFSH